jgi:Skp family chaperone for outer membrane proteins
MLHVSRLILIIGFMLSSAFAKTGVVDVKAVIEGSAMVKKTAADLEKRFLPKRNELMAMQKSLEKDTKKLTQEKAAMKPADIQALSKKIADSQQSLLEKEQVFRAEVMKAQNQAIEKAMEQVKAASSKVAKDKGMDLVVAAGESIYFDPSLDITDAVKQFIAKA